MIVSNRGKPACFAFHSLCIAEVSDSDSWEWKGGSSREMQVKLAVNKGGGETEVESLLV